MATVFPSAVGIVIVGWQANPDRAFKQAMRDANRDTARRWHARYLPRHFRAGASSKYGYAKRQFGYTTLKRMRSGVVAPLVYKGRLRQMSKLPPRITGTAKKGRARFLVPSYIETRYVKPGKPRIADELRAVTDQEARELANFHEERLAFHMRNVSWEKRVRA